MDWWLNERSLNGGADRIPLPVDRGGLWLCGKHYVGPDVDAALARTGATRVVCLNEAHEIEERYPGYVAWLRTDRRAMWHPVPDLHAPETGAALELVQDLHDLIHRGETLLVHCGAGIGRAGTIAAAILLAMAVPLEDALETVRAHRPMAGPEAGAQRELLTDLERHLRCRRRRSSAG